MSKRFGNFKALVLSPIASHPQDYGNRNRILQMTQFLKDQGYEIHFVFYPIEPDWLRGIPPSAKEMRDAWDSFTIVPPSRPLHQASVGEHHQVDEWWDPSIGNYLDWLFTREAFDVLFVNYTYLTRAFLHAPGSTVKVLEMHDLFTGRKELFAANGEQPDFFYMVAEQEHIAFDRADIVIAIKDGEAQIVRGMTEKPAAISIPFYMPERPERPRPQRLDPATDLRVGFLGAKNVVNRVNLARFLESYAKALQLYVPNLRLDIAGNVCDQLQCKLPGVRILGRVERVEDFYNAVDVVVAPLMFSTGIKIKVGEALSFGKPVVATENGFDGYAGTDPFHALKSYDEVSRALVSLAYDRDRLLLLETNSTAAANLARRSNADGLTSFTGAVKALSRLIVLITDQPIWGIGTAQQERLALWLRQFSTSGRAAVLYVGSSPPSPSIREDLNLATFVDLSGEPSIAEAVVEALKDFERTHRVVEIVLSAGGAMGIDLWNELSLSPHLTLDLWSPLLGKVVGRWRNAKSADFWCSRANEIDAHSPQSFSVNPLPSEPLGLRDWLKSSGAAGIFIARCGPSESEEHGIELMKRMLGRSHPVSVVEVDVFGTGDSGATFAALRDLPRPTVIVAAGSDPHAAAVWCSLAQQAGAGFLHVSDLGLPLLLEDRNGDSVLCESYRDVAARLAESTGTAVRNSVHTSDTGWHGYWNMVANR